MSDHPPEDFMFAERARILVYRLPVALTRGYCFGGGHDIAFRCVDWFDAPVSGARQEIIAFIKKKSYFDPEGRFLVLCREDHPDLTFVIEPGP